MDRLLNGIGLTVGAAVLVVVGIRTTRAFDRGINERVACVLVAALFLGARTGLTRRACAAVALLLVSVPFRRPIEAAGGFLCLVAAGLFLGQLEQKNVCSQ